MTVVNSLIPLKRHAYARIGCEGQRSQVGRFIDSKEGHREGNGGPAAVVYGLGKKIELGGGCGGSGGRG